MKAKFELIDFMHIQGSKKWISYALKDIKTGGVHAPGRSSRISNTRI